MNLSRIEVFVAVASNGSFIEAGRQLGLTGAAVSKQIQNLEDELGLKLFTRTTRHVALTEEGSYFYATVGPAIADIKEAELSLNEFKECPTGPIKVNIPMSFGKQYLTKPIAKFASSYPDVVLNVDFDDRWVDVIAEGYDVVIRIGVLEDSSLRARKLASCPILLCASPEYIAEHGSVLRPDQISRLPAVTYSRHGLGESWRYQDGEAVSSVRLHSVFSSNTAEMQLEACLAGVGLAVLPAFSVDKHLRSGELVNLLPKYPTAPERGIYALFPDSRKNSTRVRLFLDAISAASSEFSWC